MASEFSGLSGIQRPRSWDSPVCSQADSLIFRQYGDTTLCKKRGTGRRKGNSKCLPWGQKGGNEPGVRVQLESCCSPSSHSRWGCGSRDGGTVGTDRQEESSVGSQLQLYAKAKEKSVTLRFPAWSTGWTNGAIFLEEKETRGKRMLSQKPKREMCSEWKDGLQCQSLPRSKA